MHQAHILRIVVASPSDVQAERNVLPGVVEELNHGIARERGLQLNITRWEENAYAGFHPEGPQGLIDAILRIEDCDIFIGIFWKRFGTPVHDAKSGTEHEFRRAYETWQQKRRPHIMMYFNQRAYAPKTAAETEQWGPVLQFRENFPKQGLWWPYNGRAQFERLVRRQLTQLILRELQQPSDSPPPAHAPGRALSASAERLRESYLNWLIEQVCAVPLTGIDPTSIREETRRDLDLAAVYTALMTRRAEATAEREQRPERDQKPLSALAVLNAERRLVLLGDPGSGKSTFINFVALCMAGEILDRPEANLTVLRTPLPGDDETRRRRPDESPPPQPWDHGPLIPIRMVLWEFVARGLLPAGQAIEVGGQTLWQFIISEMAEPLRDFAESLRVELLNHGGLLLLDGLDEVPDADQRRVQVKEAVEQFAAVFPRVRVLATSRIYAYQRQDWKLSGFCRSGAGPLRRGADSPVCGALVCLCRAGPCSVS